MITGAATATVNRLPVLLFPSDYFANRLVDPVLQQVEHPIEHDVSASDAFRPGLPLLRPHLPARAAHLQPARGVPRPHRPGRDRRRDDLPARGRPGRGLRLARAVLRAAGLAGPPAAPRAGARGRGRGPHPAARRPLIVAGGGAIYAGAEAALDALATTYGIPVSESPGRQGRPALEPPARTSVRSGPRAASRPTGWPGTRTSSSASAPGWATSSRPPGPRSRTRT